MPVKNAREKFSAFLDMQDANATFQAAKKA
jgi:hypothetical protein